MKGRGLYASRLIRSGEVVLDEAPILLLAAPEHSLAACAHCLRLMAGERSPYQHARMPKASWEAREEQRSLL